MPLPVGEGGVKPERKKREPKAPKAPKEPKAKKEKPLIRTLLDVGFERLMNGPASRKEINLALQVVEPGYSGTRANDLCVRLRNKNHVTEIQAEEGDPKVTVRRTQLNPTAVADLLKTGELILVDYVVPEGAVEGSADTQCARYTGDDGVERVVRARLKLNLNA
jgi:hypothetical protein